MVVTEYDVGPGAYGVAVATDGVVWTSLVERGELAGVGPDRTLWYTLLAADRVDEISFQPGAEPHGLAIASDDTLWVALEAGSLAHLTS